MRAEIQEAHITGLRRVRVDNRARNFAWAGDDARPGPKSAAACGAAFITGMYAAPEQRTPEQAKAIACPMRSLMNCSQSGRYKTQPQTEGD